MEPERVGKPLRFELECLRAARRGDYRVIYEIRQDRGDVLIHVIEHRADVYRRR
jgi:mRNA-degrading endonuclease RelE of RelBE toxin-antitoxin system